MPNITDISPRRSKEVSHSAYLYPSRAVDPGSASRMGKVLSLLSIKYLTH